MICFLVEFFFIDVFVVVDEIWVGVCVIVWFKYRIFNFKVSLNRLGCGDGDSCFVEILIWSFV